MNLNRISAVNLMNTYGKKKIPFLFIVDFEMEQPIILRFNEINSSNLLFNINGIKNYKEEQLSIKPVLFDRYPVSFDTYRKAFDNVISELNAGNTYLLNLTFPTKIETNLSLREIFYRSNAKYKLIYNDKFVVFSPETFVVIDGGIISAFPMKGTIDADIENAREMILQDKKETAEHNTIVDLIRNDLNTVARGVSVNNFRYIEKIETNYKSLLQVSSEVSGRLDDNYFEKIGEIIFSMLPAGSITGAPKKKTIEIIKQNEPYRRGYYTGVFGYFDGNKLESAVMIRFIENTGEGLIFKSGGGITSMSNCESEYEEMIDKVYVPFH